MEDAVLPRALASDFSAQPQGGSWAAPEHPDPTPGPAAGPPASKRARTDAGATPTGAGASWPLAESPASGRAHDGEYVNTYEVRASGWQGEALRSDYRT